MSPGAGPEMPEEIIRYAALGPDRRELMMHIHDLLEQIAFGSVVIVVQGGKVVQVETSEKIRLK